MLRGSLCEICTTPSGGFFCRCCEGGGIDPLHPTASQVLDYLEHLTSIPLEDNTTLTHLLALSSCSSLFEGYTVGSHPLVTAWVKGHRAEFPPKTIRVPQRKLSSVLVMPTEQDLKPLTKAKLEFLTRFCSWYLLHLPKEFQNFTLFA